MSPMYVSGTPAYRGRMLRESKCMTVDAAAKTATVDLTVGKVAHPCTSETVLRISDVFLTQNDMNRLKPGQWLNDSLINAGQALLRDKFPGVHGLQDVLLSKTLTFQPQNGRKFVQILNCEDLHWVCISTINCKSQMVN